MNGESGELNLFVFFSSSFLNLLLFKCCLFGFKLLCDCLQNTVISLVGLIMTFSLNLSKHICLILLQHECYELEYIFTPWTLAFVISLKVSGMYNITFKTISFFTSGCKVNSNKLYNLTVIEESKHQLVLSVSLEELLLLLLYIK